MCLNDSNEVGYRHTFKSFLASHQIKLEVKMGWLTDHRDYVTLTQRSAVHAPVQANFAGCTFCPGIPNEDKIGNNIINP